MKTMQAENAKTRFFVSKEDYLKFKQSWKNFHNSDKLVWREDVEVYSWELDKKITMKNIKHTALGPEHYMLYNLLRGYDSRTAIWRYAVSGRSGGSGKGHSLRVSSVPARGMARFYQSGKRGKTTVLEGASEGSLHVIHDARGNSRASFSYRGVAQW